MWGDNKNGLSSTGLLKPTAGSSANREGNRLFHIISKALDAYTSSE